MLFQDPCNAKAVPGIVPGNCIGTFLLYSNVFQLNSNSTHVCSCSTLNLTLCYDLEVMSSKSELRASLVFIN